MTDYSSYKLNFDQGKKSETITTAAKSVLKLVKIQSLVAKYCKTGKIIAVRSLQTSYKLVLCGEDLTIFGIKVVILSIMQNLQTSHGYI